jgi:hypothetical protein
MKCTRIGEKRCFEIDQEMDAILLIIGIVYGQLLAHGRWFSLGTPASSTTKTMI